MSLNGVCVLVCVCICPCVYVSVYMCVYVCMCVFVYVCAHLCALRWPDILIPCIYSPLSCVLCLELKVCVVPQLILVYCHGVSKQQQAVTTEISIGLGHVAIKMLVLIGVYSDGGIPQPCAAWDRLLVTLTKISG